MCESVSLWAFLVKFPSDTKHRIFAWPCIKHSIIVICVIRNHYLRYENALTPQSHAIVQYIDTYYGSYYTEQPPTMDLEAHSYEVHMEPYIHNFIWNLFELHKKLLLISYELHMKFIWTSREFHMKWNRIYSYEIHEKFINFIWSSNELLMNFIWNEIKVIHMNLHAVRMKLIWSSYRKTNEVNMLYPCNANEVDMRLINSSHEIHMKFIWILNDLNFMWTSCEIHKNYMKNTHEYGF